MLAAAAACRMLAAAAVCGRFACGRFSCLRAGGPAVGELAHNVCRGVHSQLLTLTLYAACGVPCAVCSACCACCAALRCAVCCVLSSLSSSDFNQHAKHPGSNLLLDISAVMSLALLASGEVVRLCVPVVVFVCGGGLLVTEGYKAQEFR